MHSQFSDTWRPSFLGIRCVTLPWGCGSGLSLMVLSHGPGAMRTSPCRGHDLSNFSLDPDTPSCIEGEAAQKALGLCRPRCWRGGGGEWPASQETPGHRGLLAPDAATSAGGGPAGRRPELSQGHWGSGWAAGCPRAAALPLMAPGSSLWWNDSRMLLFEPENKLKNDLLNWNWTELKNNYIFFQLPTSALNEILKWKTNYFFHWSFCFGIWKKKKFLIPTGIITLKIF